MFQQRLKQAAQTRPIREEIERLLSNPRRCDVKFPRWNQVVSASGDCLKKLDVHLPIFFGDDGQDAAHFLYLTWLKSYGADSDYDLKKGLEQFWGYVIDAAIKPAARRGKQESEMVTFAKQLRKDKVPYKQICEQWFEKEGKLEWWKSLEPEDQQTEIRQLGDKVRQSNKRKRKKKETVTK